MALQLQNFTTLVQNMAASVQSSCAQLLNFNTGSVVRAIQEANASVALWLQWLILQVLALTRLATSNGTDVDSWVADFGLTRLSATATTGSVTFTRYSNTTAAYLPVGALVKTIDGSRTYQVTLDTTNSAYYAPSNSYIAPSGFGSVTVPVVDITTDQFGNLAVGSAGNIQANTIGLIASTVPFDTVTNASAFTNGVDAETDAALRARFQNYVQTRSRGTLAAIGYAISQVQQGVQYTIQENVNSVGTYTPGSFVVTVDDGTGNASSSLIANVGQAISTYRPIGSVWFVQGPSVTTATIAMTITCNPTTNKTTALLASVQAAVIAYVNSLPDGTTLPYSRLAMVAYMVDPSIVDVTGVTLNSGTADLVPSATGVIKATTGSVSVT